MGGPCKYEPFDRCQCIGTCKRAFKVEMFNIQSIHCEVVVVHYVVVPWRTAIRVKRTVKVANPSRPYG
jgi:hypothetical protein